MPTAIINGKAYDGVDISIQMFGSDIQGFKGIEIKPTIAFQNNHGKGKNPYSYSRGKIDYTGSISLYAEALEDIRDTVPLGKTIMEIPPFPIIIKMDNGTGRVITRKAMAMFGEEPGGGKTDDMGIYYDIPLHITQLI